MTREISTYLTKTSAAYLRDAVGALSRDMFNRHHPEATTGLEAAQIAFDWKANDNEERFRSFLRGDKKFNEHLEKQNANFCAAVDAIAEYAFDYRTSWPEPTEWTKHFPNRPTMHGVIAAKYPDEKKFKEGSFENSMAWSDFNIQRMAQHRLTLSICSDLVIDSHVFKHLQAPLVNAGAWARSQARDLDNTRMQLILLEGDPNKIQALREEIMNEFRKDNRSTGHFYGHFNDPNGSGSTEAEKRFKTAALRHVQAGFEPGNGSQAKTDLSYSDLGLG